MSYYYDDHFYCEKCGKHDPFCWCWSSKYSYDATQSMNCSGGEGHGP